MSIISNNIKYLRRLNGLTQEQFSHRIGIKRSLLGAYEEARANPNLDNLKVIAQVFGTSVDALIKTDIRRIRETPSISPKSIGEIIERANNETEEEKDIPIFRQESKVIEEVPSQTPKDFTKETLLLEKEFSFVLVRRNKVIEYLQQRTNPSFLESLPSIELPFLPKGKYRAFEIGEDFIFSGSILIGEYIANYEEIKNGKNYVLLTKNQGVIYRRAYNQIAIKGNLLLSSDNASLPSFEIAEKDIIEVWEVKAYVSLQLPEPQIQLEKVKSLVKELQKELEKS